MWLPNRPAHLHSSAYTRRETKFVNRDFQVSYTRKTVFIATVAMALFLIPALYWTNQNYEFFIEMAYGIQPDLVKHLEGERNTLNTLFMAAIAGQFIFLLVAGQRMTDKIVAPLKILRNHIRLLSRGDMTMPPMYIRNEDEFHDLVTAYNYYYSSLQSQTDRDLARMHEALVHVTHPLAREIINEMISEKRQQLNHHVRANGALSAEARDSRHVS